MRKIIIVVLLALASVAQAQELSFDPPPAAPGELVDVGGYRLHLYCIGEGSPTVILEPGFARFSLNLRALQEASASVTRVCTYDHAGYGWSEPGPGPRTAQQLADELAALLDHGGVEPPYILAAHSLGGLVARLFAAQHPDVTAGVILIDATTPEYLQNPDVNEDLGGLRMMLGMARDIATQGTWSQQALAPLSQLLTDVPTELHDTYLSLATQPAYFEAAIGELDNRLTSVEQVIAAGNLGDVPLVVLVAGTPLESDEPVDALWVASQVEQAKLSSDIELSFLVGGNHDFYITQPEVVVRAVRRMIEEA